MESGRMREVRLKQEPKIERQSENEPWFLRRKILLQTIGPMTLCPAIAADVRSKCAAHNPPAPRSVRINTHIVHQHLRWKGRRSLRLARPTSADGEIEDDVVALPSIERPVS